MEFVINCDWRKLISIRCGITQIKVMLLLGTVSRVHNPVIQINTLGKFCRSQ